jgi:DNA ligase (NAD+)
VEELVSWGFLSTPVDIFKLEEANRAKPEEERLEGREGWGELSARNLFASVRGARALPLDRFIYSLGILHVGLTTAQAMAEHFGGDVQAWWGGMTRLADGEEVLDTIDGIGPVVAQAVAAFMHEPKNREVIEGLLAQVQVQAGEQAGVNGVGQGVEGAVVPSPLLEGKRVIFTGTLAKATRSQAEALARGLGAKTVKTITKSVDYVIVGADAGLKAAKAEELGLRILTEEEWDALIQEAMGS